MTRHAPAADCALSPPPERSLVDAETVFAHAAQASQRQAFLGVLADDAWVLSPGPIPARAFFESRPESPGRLDWYPSVAVVAHSGDLGFTSGPYTETLEDVQSFGHFLTVWRQIDCRWRVVLDGGISHGRVPLEDRVERGATPTPAAPAESADDPAAAFQAVAGREGLAAALRTYARNEGFLLLLEGQPPMALGAAVRQLRTRVRKGSWREAARGASADTTLSYVVGADDAGAYVEVWQYDSRTANWGLRVLLLTQP